MKISLIALLLISFSSSAGDFEFAIGAGHEYGGILGGQFAYKTEYSKYYGSVGVVGFSTGFQTTFSKNSKHAYGVTVGAEAIDSSEGFLFATYNYHFKGFSNNGFVIGTGIGFTKGDGVPLGGGCYVDCPSTEKKAMITLNIGYKF
ncbi:hypothetical protein [Colwellia piezophila]|uniref:hypothetical protein n=1 Tax=Colwellia piezophila TaxID=211668 RepID=UPI000361C0CB|nr:hypothetical protein [Colwellia piezophila]